MTINAALGLGLRGPAAHGPAARGHAARGRLRLSRAARVIPLAALAVLSGCFATRGDVRIVQGDVVALRAELLRKDAEQNATLAKAMALLTAATDSLARISARTIGIQGDVRGEMRAVKEQLLQVQTLLGQSQANINRIRAELEARAQAPVQPPPAPLGTPPSGSTTTPATTPVPVGAVSAGVDPARPDTSIRTVGPSVLYQEGMDAMRRGAPQAARTAFQELLSTYPTSDKAPAAQYQIGESLFKEKNYAAADAAYGAVVAKYADSPNAPTALFRRATIAKLQSNMTEAKKLFQEVIRRFPQSDEADLAADELKLIK